MIKREKHILATALKGKLKALEAKTLSKTFWARPLVTQKAISLIYWQALKLKNNGVEIFSFAISKITADKFEFKRLKAIEA